MISNLFGLDDLPKGAMVDHVRTLLTDWKLKALTLTYVFDQKTQQPSVYPKLFGYPFKIALSHGAILEKADIKTLH